MAIVVIRQDDKIDDWKEALQLYAPQIAVYDYREEHPREAVKMAVVWKHPPGSLQGYPNLECISSSGAGVDFLFEDDRLPKHLPITRVVDEYLSKDMSEHVIALIFSLLKNLYHYKVDQFNKIWKPVGYKRISDLTIGIMGLGALGSVLAKDLVRFGFKVRGWSSSEKNIQGVETFTGPAGRTAFLEATQILVCLLPLTDDTKGILNAGLFRQLPKGAYLINVARGGHLVDGDLLEMLDNGHLSGAALDVYHQEPLSLEHPFWEHPKVHMTPHYASVSETISVVPQIVENYRRLASGEELLNLVSEDKKY
ncbi:2-hydroxyacid dehydrogenase [Maribacter polysaccharolyticus]|uniref:2-hydroxyacid dehydrogenase n=1 Tax=Maribacter polysaccharolyticus TaxID=3020831 RepID=UPI00237FC006|nr:glyoxylate/hydroxypyruvate reductase A [Maribacter polysaccharolyticus]MDE3740417.1 glyoxylate/hydroxypyruvate reductase A [Maribacter polysaccharolyticus]